MSDLNVTVTTTPISVTATEQISNVIVNPVGVQGPSGQKGQDGIATITGADYYGLISTGDADLRYLSSGSSGYFYPWSNPNNFLRSGEATNTSNSAQIYSISYLLSPTGNDAYRINFSNEFSVAPLIVGNLTTTGNGNLRAFDISGLDISGFTLRLSEVNNDPYLKFDYYIISGSGALGVSSFSNSVSYKLISQAYNVSSSDDFVECSGFFNVTLPTAVGNLGRKYIIKNSNTGTIFVTTSSPELIDSATGINLSQYDAITVISNNSKWLIV